MASILSPYIRKEPYLDPLLQIIYVSHITLKFIIDAFSSDVFKGNPAAVCPLSEWLPPETMQSIAAENNLSETAFFVPKGDDYSIRWFTPVPLPAAAVLKSP